jgi:hypothetical protein
VYGRRRCLDPLAQLQRAVIDVDEHRAAGGGIGQQRRELVEVVQ